ncbi:unnamed protein product [Angiostrongylus costaricensis]|uniref:RUS1 family protein C16orf58 homolog n=1 Tax=Angiostrongylus costaricensis TaxID=334426 RepID=A0A0R3PQS2_ANGCS|nr:unnamed protein product [Angiostrongylus costaricensis]
MEFFTESYSGRPIRKVCYHSGTHVPTSSVTNVAGVSGTLLSCWSRLKTLLTEIFLPQGYPSSVSDDYMQYQRWDTLQAFASSLTGALATEAVLKGAGVGDQSASTLAASLTWLTKDGLGMIGRSELDYDCKKWRFVADIFNDLAFFIDLISPALSGSFFVCACTSSILRSVVGVAGGATRTAIVQHQARRNNLADVASKDGSQETVVNISALLVSLIMLPLVSGKLAFIFTFTHLYANYQAVRSLNMETMNQKRAFMLIRSWLSCGKILSVRECNIAEPLFSSFGKRYLGCSLFDLLSYHRRVPSSRLVMKDSYTLLFDTSRNIGWIAMADGGCNYSALNALFDLETLAKKDTPSNDFIIFMDELRKHGWEVNISNLGFDEWAYSTK